MQIPRFLLLAALLAAASAGAQTAPPGTPAPERTTTTRDASNQRIERIEVQDAGSRIDELRVGGETRSITVQPKVGGKLPAYEVRPNNGTRVWNLGRF